MTALDSFQVLALNLQRFEIALFFNPKSAIPARRMAGRPKYKIVPELAFRSGTNYLAYK